MNLEVQGLPLWAGARRGTAPAVWEHVFLWMPKQRTAVLLWYLPLLLKNHQQTRVCTQQYLQFGEETHLYSVDGRDNRVAGLGFSRRNLSSSPGPSDDCSFLWQSVCDVKNHMLYAKLNLRCERLVCKRGSVEIFMSNN